MDTKTEAPAGQKLLQHGYPPINHEHWNLLECDRIGKEETQKCYQEFLYEVEKYKKSHPLEQTSRRPSEYRVYERIWADPETQNTKKGWALRVAPAGDTNEYDYEDNTIADDLCRIQKVMPFLPSLYASTPLEDYKARPIPEHCIERLREAMSLGVQEFHVAYPEIRPTGPCIITGQLGDQTIYIDKMPPLAQRQDDAITATTHPHAPDLPQLPAQRLREHGYPHITYEQIGKRLHFEEALERANNRLYRELLEYAEQYKADNPLRPPFWQKQQYQMHEYYRDGRRGWGLRIETRDILHPFKKSRHKSCLSVQGNKIPYCTAAFTPLEEYIDRQIPDPCLARVREAAALGLQKFEVAYPDCDPHPDKCLITGKLGARWFYVDEF